ncbi:SDR family NAD(P)-dependent oxidoreductase [Georgenia alba]|uniref:SDR family NAD(P)-dependent oxidoreductase n=1 Tax=Georgenia alba TaxID=2233858 RepID=A0ABW2Q3U8_9MICO
MTDDDVPPFPAERTAVVTGGASDRGIGRALVRRLAAGGWAVAVLDLDGDRAGSLASAVAGEHGVAALGLAVDVADERAVDEAIGRVERELPPVVGLANAAGISDPTPFLDLTLSRWEEVLRTNATGTFVVTRRVAPGMVERGLGRIVTFSSTAAQNGGGNYSKSSYAASKGAIEGMSRAAALELAPHGVTVNVIAPATIDTDIMGGPITHERLPGFVRSLPVGRVGRTEEVAALVEHLLGPEAGYITGATYNINGGLRIG